MQVASTLFPAFGLPDWPLRGVILLLAIGFVPARVAGSAALALLVLLTAGAAWAGEKPQTPGYAAQLEAAYSPP